MFNRLGISHKIYLAFGTLVVLMALISFGGYMGGWHQSRALDNGVGWRGRHRD